MYCFPLFSKRNHWCGYLTYLIIQKQGLNDFCQFHSKLKELHFLAPLEMYGEEAIESFGVGDWKLLSLQVLSYHCQRMSQSIITAAIFKGLCYKIDFL